MTFDFICAVWHYFNALYVHSVMLSARTPKSAL